MQYVGFGRRLVAALLDGLIIGVINFLLGTVLGLLMVGGVSGGDAGATSMATLFGYIVGLVVGVGYWVVYQGSVGQTIGKKVMGIKVVDENGAKPSMMTFGLREIIGKLVSSIILLIGYFMVLWDSKKQGLHDKIASTYVVKA